MIKIHIDPEILAVRELHGELLVSRHSGSRILERLTLQVNAILDGHKVGNSAVAFHLGSWCPGFADMTSAQIMSTSLSLEQAQQAIAREHGFAHWSDVILQQDTQIDEAFEKAVDAVVHGNVTQLNGLLDSRPQLAKQRSQYGHRATLLNYVGANGVESYRQITPLNAPEIAQCLIDAGADVNARANVYGGSTTLNLLLTSAHPHNAGVVPEVADVLRRAGAA